MNENRHRQIHFVKIQATASVSAVPKQFPQSDHVTLDCHLLQVELAVYYDNDHTTGHLQVAKKLGLPEVIFPSDVRNDLYVNILHGELGR